MAKHSWPGQRAIGQRMHVGNPKQPLPWATVVGVVADTKMGSRDQPSDDQWYMPAQQPATLNGTEPAGKLTDPASGYITLRSSLPPEQMTQTVRYAVADVDPLLALQQVQTMDEALSNNEAPRRFNTDLITTFAVGALLLAITGIYSVVAFSVSLRTQEIAVRMALGAQRTRIARLVLASSAKLALLGCGIGVAGSLAALAARNLLPLRGQRDRSSDLPGRCCAHDAVGSARRGDSRKASSFWRIQRMPCAQSRGCFT